MNAFARFSRTGAAAVALVFALGASAMAEEVNSTQTGLILHGGIGTGQSMFGVIYNTTGLFDLGTGSGQGLDLGALANYQIFTFGLGFTAVNLKDLDWTEYPTTGPDISYDYSSSGGGYYWVLDATLGAKVFTEPGDMGYTHFFIGLRVWKAVREEDSRTREGVSQTPVDFELAGNGWVFGFRDFSTLGVGDFALAFQTGLWISKAPLSSFKVNGADQRINSADCFGFGLEAGIGVAMESMGLAVIGGIKMDVQVTDFTWIIFDTLAGAGYSQFFLVFKKELAL